MDQYLNEPDSFLAYLVERVASLEDKLSKYEASFSTTESEPIELEPVELEPIELELDQPVLAAEDAPVAQTGTSRAVALNPVPMSWNISQAQGSDGPVVVVHVQTPEGDKYFFLSPTIAQQLGEALIKLSTSENTLE